MNCCCEFFVKVDELFLEKLSVDVLEKCDKKLLSFCDMCGNTYNVNEVKEELAQRIKGAEMGAREERKGLHVRRLYNGRFCEDNIYAEKFQYLEEAVYLLYLLCGNMNEVASLLGVCRQTVSQKIKHYKERRC